ncbi:MAG TPA: DUF805 domain-containing protein [Allosphingosinicella sp.]|nr:DUF805 domain-containing protein [Allosphingosinicella sp.]
MTSGFALAWEPLVRYADFSGRSRRSDLLFFYVLTILLNVLIDWAGLLAGLHDYRWLSLAFTLMLLCPWAALAVRRLHDSGRGGWWLLLGLPVLALNLWDDWRRLGDPFALSVQSSLPILVEIPLALALLALIVLLFWEDEEGPNCYGPNPRYDSEETTA